MGKRLSHPRCQWGAASGHRAGVTIRGWAARCLPLSVIVSYPSACLQVCVSVQTLKRVESRSSASFYSSSMDGLWEITSNCALLFSAHTNHMTTLRGTPEDGCRSAFARLTEEEEWFEWLTQSLTQWLTQWMHSLHSSTFFNWWLLDAEIFRVSFGKKSPIFVFCPRNVATPLPILSLLLDI